MWVDDKPAGDGYLVNKSLSAAGILEDNAPEDCPKNEQLAEKPIISQGERTWFVPVYFVDFFLFLCAELSTSFFNFSVTGFCKEYSFVFHDRLEV